MNSKRHFGSFINRKSNALLAAVVLMLSAAADMALAKTAKEIDTSVNACMDRFYKQVKDGKEIAAKAKGVLVGSTGKVLCAWEGRRFPTTILLPDRLDSKSAGRPRTSSSCS